MPKEAACQLSPNAAMGVQSRWGFIYAVHLASQELKQKRRNPQPRSVFRLHPPCGDLTILRWLQTNRSPANEDPSNAILLGSNSAQRKVKQGYMDRQSSLWPCLRRSCITLLDVAFTIVPGIELVLHELVQLPHPIVLCSTELQQLERIIDKDPNK